MVYKMKGIIFFFIPILMINITAGARILGIFMIDAYSHFNINNAIMETLAMGGHEVTVISTLKPTNPLANITYIQARKTISEHLSVWSTKDLRKITWSQLYEILRQVFEQDCDRFMALKEVQDILAEKHRKFDLLFVELLPACECHMSVAWRHDIPIIGTSSVDLRVPSGALLGNPYHPSIIPHYLSVYTSRMTFVERLINTIETIYVEFLTYRTTAPDFEKLFQKYFPRGDLKLADISLVFLNNHASLFPLPQVPGFIEIGGIHLKPPQSLPQYLDEFIRGAEHGVILFSLGSIASIKDLGIETTQIFQKVFAKIPQRVVWKYEERIDGVSDNVLISQWIPQQDILAQENVVLFISHVGKSSTLEAIHTGTPILAVPLFTDQLSNAGNIRDLGIGKVVDIDTITEPLLLNSIQEMLQNKSYVDKAKKLSRAFRDRPMSAKQTALYWTEYVLRRNGTIHLRNTAADLPFYRYLLLDVISFTAISFALGLIFVSYFIKKVFDLIFFCCKNKKIS